MLHNLPELSIMKLYENQTNLSEQELNFVKVLVSSTGQKSFRVRRQGVFDTPAKLNFYRDLHKHIKEW